MDFISVLLLLCVLEVFIIQYLVHLVCSGSFNIPYCCFVLVICTVDVEYVNKSFLVNYVVTLCEWQLLILTQRDG